MSLTVLNYKCPVCGEVESNRIPCLDGTQRTVIKSRSDLLCGPCDARQTPSERELATAHYLAHPNLWDIIEES